MKKILLTLCLLASTQIYASETIPSPSGTISFEGAIVEPTCQINSQMNCVKNNKVIPARYVFKTEITQINTNNRLITVTYY